MKSLVRTFLLLLILAFLFAAALPSGGVSPARAQGPAPQIQAEAAFDGYFKYGEWLPVWVNLTNQGADVDGEVRVRVQRSFAATTFAVPVSLPSGARKRVPVYVLPNNFTREIEVQYVAEGQALASQRVTVRPQANISFLVGIIAPRQGAMSQVQGVELPGTARPLVLLDFPLASLPDRVEGLRSLDVLILNDVDTSTLTPAQVETLEAWVQAGGRLVLGGGAGAQQVASGFPESLLPLRPAGSVELQTADLESLAGYAGTDPVLTPGPFLAATGSLLQGEVLAGSPQLPLVVERRLGNGAVDFIAMDLSVAPFEGWSGTTAFWEAILGPGSAYPDGLPPDMSPRQLRSSSMPYALTNMPVLDLPSVRSLSLLLVFYILLVGPVNYLVLRWRKRLHWAWVTIPLVTVIFSAGAFSLGYSLRGSDIIVNKIAMVELAESGVARVTSYLGLFSPGSQSYEVAVEGDSLLSPVAGYDDPWAPVPSGGAATEMVFVQGEPGEVRGLTVDQWSLQSFMSEDVWPDFGQVTADLTIKDGVVTGTVRNDTGYTLTDAVVILRRQFVRIGDLAPGQEAEVNLSWRNPQEQRFGPPLSYLLFEQEFASPSPTGPAREAELKRAVVESVFERGPWSGLNSKLLASSPGEPELLLIGWMDQAPPSVTVSGRLPAEQATAMVYTTLHYELPTSGRLVLQPGMIPGVMTQPPRDGGFCGDLTSTGVYLSSGEAVFEFRLPDGLQDFDLEVLNLNLWSDMGWWRAPDVSFYDWVAGEWRQVTEPVQGENPILDPAPLVSDEALIRLRIAGENTPGCYFIDLGLEASALGGQGG